MAKGATGITRIHWKEPQWEKVIARAVELTVAHPDWSSLDVARKAQLVLEPKYQRPIRTITIESWREYREELQKRLTREVPKIQIPLAKVNRDHFIRLEEATKSPATKQEPPRDPTSSEYSEIVEMLGLLANALQDMRKPTKVEPAPQVERDALLEELKHIGAFRQEHQLHARSVTQIDNRVSAIDRRMDKMESMIVRLGTSVDDLAKQLRLGSIMLGQAGPAPPALVPQRPVFRNPNVLVIGLDSGHSENHIRNFCKGQVSRLEFRQAVGVTIPDCKPWDFIVVTKKAPTMWVAAAKAAIPREKYKDAPGNADNVARVIKELPQIKMEVEHDPQAVVPDVGGSSVV